MNHKIEVIPEPDHEMGNTPYFWCVLTWGEKDWYNNGCGWSETPEKAFKEAKLHYNQLLK